MKIDVYRDHRDDYITPKKPALLMIAPARYMTVEGKGSPGGAEFQEMMGALYRTAYALKFAFKKKGRDFKVPMPEGLWTAVGGGKNALTMPKKTWRWKLLVRVPEFVTPAAVAAALKELGAKKDPQPTVKLETIREGKSVQILHVDAYGDERATIAKMEAFAKEHKLRFRGAHHEIYLSDPRRVPASRLRTILRHAVS